MTKTYCDICGEEVNKYSKFNITLGTNSFGGYVSIDVSLDICDDCKNSSSLLEEVWISSDFKSSEFQDNFKRKLIKMIKEK